MRHLGLVRRQFWRKLSGTAKVSIKSTQFKTSSDLTLELDLNEKVYYNIIIIRYKLMVIYIHLQILLLVYFHQKLLL